RMEGRTAQGRPAGRRALFPYYELYLSLRYLRSRVSAVAALLSVTFGVAVILIVLSIMGGYIDVLRETIRGQDSHLAVIGPAPFSVLHVTDVERTLRAVPNVKATAPYVETIAMYKSGQFSPCQLQGILPSRQVEVTSLGGYVLRPEELDAVLGKLDAEAPDAEARGAEARGAEAGGAEAGDGAAGAGEARDGGRGPRDSRPAARRIDDVLRAPGRRPLEPAELEAVFQPESARKLLERRNPATLAALGGEIPPAALVGIHLLLEGQVRLGQVVPIVTMDPRTHEPRYQWFVVTGAFKTGEYEFDSRTVYVHVDDLKNVLDLFDPEANAYRYEGVRVALLDLGRSRETLAAIKAALATAHPSLAVVSWESQKTTLLDAVKIEKFIIYFLLVLLMGFTGCMVLLILLLTVIEKTRDMGVLLALGARPGGVVRIFLANGFILSAAGTVLGLVLGYLFCLNINPIHDWIYAATGLELFPAKIYRMDRIPILFQPQDVLLSVAPPIVFGCLASLIPAIWASRRDPIKAIHYE
ncbi:MAG: ABC transporter permease, partial [Planctomycetes bacterium]|nr:ABC transporter permease [Planctomycetota bacterium]